MMVSDVGKIVLLSLIIVGCIFLIAIDRIVLDDVRGLFGAALGYIIGTGEIAMRKKVPTPLIVPKLDENTIVTPTQTIDLTQINNKETEQ
jgi:hypothetical protein